MCSGLGTRNRSESQHYMRFRPIARLTRGVSGCFPIVPIGRGLVKWGRWAQGYSPALSQVNWVRPPCARSTLWCSAAACRRGSKPLVICPLTSWAPPPARPNQRQSQQVAKAAIERLDVVEQFHGTLNKRIHAIEIPFPRSIHAPHFDENGNGLAAVSSHGTRHSATMEALRSASSTSFNQDVTTLSRESIGNNQASQARAARLP